MSVHLEALADEVFGAAAAQARGGGDMIRLPFGEVRRNRAYPDLLFLNGLTELRAPDWTVHDLEQAVAEHLTGLRGMRLASRDADTIARLGPRLISAGYEGECRVAMVQVAPQLDTSSSDVKIRAVEGAADWHAFEQLVSEDTREHGWTAQMREQLIRLYRWQADNQPQAWLLALDGPEPLGQVGVYQHATVGYLHALFVRPAGRRRGVGSALVRGAERHARALGCDRLTLQCHRDSFLPAFYGTVGFRTVGEMCTWMKSLTP